MKIKYEKTVKTEHEVDVLTCPFCGSDKAKLRSSTQYSEVACVSCGARGPEYREQESAVEAWNTRN
jgi:Lar family restriction alleviation protein